MRAPSGNGRFEELRGLMREGGLHTVCEEARCPNIGECWGRGTATFQIMGDVCTRACRYCAVTSGRPETAPEPLEPLRVARAVAADGAAPRGRHLGRPRRPARPRRRPLRRHHPRHPPARRPTAASRCWCPTSSASGRRRCGSCSRRRPTSSTTTSRRPSTCTGGCGRRATTARRSTCSTAPRTCGRSCTPPVRRS